MREKWVLWLGVGVPVVLVALGICWLFPWMRMRLVETILLAIFITGAIGAIVVSIGQALSSKRDPQA